MTVGQLLGTYVSSLPVHVSRFPTSLVSNTVLIHFAMPMQTSIAGAVTPAALETALAEVTAVMNKVSQPMKGSH
jgi:hypothetical protein